MKAFTERFSSELRRDWISEDTEIPEKTEFQED